MSTKKQDDIKKGQAGSRKSQRSLASAKSSERSASEKSPSKGKAKTPKQLTAKQKEKLRAEEKARKLKLEELIKDAEAKKQEFDRLQMEAKTKEAKEKVEQRRRERTLVGVVEIYKMMIARLTYERVRRREEASWERYVNTDVQAPFPEDPVNMSMHLYHWRQQLDVDLSMEKTLDKCQFHLATLDALDDLLQDPVHTLPETVELWAESRTEWRYELLNKIDQATFHVIRNIEGHFDQLNFFEVYFARTVERIKLGIWAWLDLPLTDAHSREMPEIDFNELNGVKILLPPEYSKINIIVRALYLDADFLSDTCPSFFIPEETTVKMEENLLEETKRCITIKKEIKDELAEQEKEKLRQAKQKIIEARNAVLKAEQSLHSYRTVMQDKLLTMQTTSVTQSDSELPVDQKKPSLTMSGRAKKKRKVGLFLQGDIIPMDSKPNQYTREDKKYYMARASQGLLVRSFSMTDPQEKLSAPSSSALLAMGSLSDHYKTKVELFYTPSMTTLDPPQRSRTRIIREESTDLGISRLEDLISISSESVDSMDDSERFKAEEEKRKADLAKHAQEEAKKNKEETKKKAIKGAGAKRGKSTMKRRTTGTHVEPIQQTPSAVFESKEEQRQWEYATSLETKAPLPEFINLREYRIVGGVYYLHILDHLPQPLRNYDQSIVQYLPGDAKIKIIDFKYDYVPPPVVVVEEGMPHPPQDPNLKNFIKLQLPLPSGIAFMNTNPTLVIWDAEACYWSTMGIHRYEVLPEANKVTCLLGKTAPLAFAVKRYDAFLPLDSWNLRPLIIEKDGLRPIELTLRTKSGNFTFVVKDSKVKLESVEIDENAKTAVDPILKKELYVPALIKSMRSAGMDIFPEEDSFQYVTTHSAKDKILEEHNYMVMSIYCSVINFSSSKWNYMGGRRIMKYQAREATTEGPEIRYTTVNSTIWRADMFKVNDESDEFVETKLNENYGFCADTYTLMEKTFSRQDPYQCTSPNQIMTVFHLLCSTRVLSYSGVKPKEAMDQLDKMVDSSSIAEGKRKRRRKSLKLERLLSLRKQDGSSSKDTVSSKSVASQ